MGHVHERDADLIVNRIKFDKHVLAKFKIESRQRLVKKQDLGSVNERTGDGDTLLLTA